MKFLLVNHEYPPVGGGAATASQAIASNLTDRGHGVVVVTTHHGKLPSYSTEEGVIVYRLKCIRKCIDRSNVFEMLSFVMAAFFRLPFILAKHQPDALIIFFSLPSGPLGLVAKIFAKLPYVISLRGGDVPGLVPELDSLHKVLAPLRRVVLRHARAVIANSEGLGKLSEAADSYPVRVIPNGVDTEFFRPGSARSPSSAANDALRVLFVGRFQEQKNLEVLLQQLARFPSGSFELHLVGNGPLETRLRALADQLEIGELITWHGWLPRLALPKVYQSADCLVNPSLYEGMPNVVLEAMASGLPVIASNISGHEALALNGETGIIFDVEQPDTLFSAIGRLVNDRELGHKLGTMGRARAVSEFSWRRTTDSYLELLSD